MVKQLRTLCDCTEPLLCHLHSVSWGSLPLAALPCPLPLADDPGRKRQETEGSR